MAGRAEGSGTARHTCVLEAGSFAATAARCPPPPAAAHRRSLPPPRTNHPAARPALQGRYVTVVQHGGQLFCLDSICMFTVKNTVNTMLETSNTKDGK